MSSKLSDWIVWPGGKESPIPKSAVFRFQCRDGYFSGLLSNPQLYRWSHTGETDDIVRYQVDHDSLLIAHQERQSFIERLRQFSGGGHGG